MAVTPRKTKSKHLRLDARLCDMVRREADRRRITMSAIVEAALHERYDPEHDRQQETLLLKELRGLRHEVRQVDFGNRVLTELTTVTAKNLFARLPTPTPAGKSGGEAFYNSLLAHVTQVFSAQTPLLDKLTASLLTASEADIGAVAAAMEAGWETETVSESESEMVPESDPNAD